VRRAASVLLAVLALAPAGAAADRQTALDTNLVRQINAVRRAHGLRPLTVSPRLAAAAAQHTLEMGKDGYFDHASYDATPFWKRIRHWYPSSGSRRWVVGENLVYGSPGLTAADAVSTWMGSAPHRANLLGRDWREIGISAVHFDDAPGEFGDGPVTIVTVDFGARR
jgi:uncharacterized protein YkwD